MSFDALRSAGTESYTWFVINSLCFFQRFDMGSMSVSLPTM